MICTKCKLNKKLKSFHKRSDTDGYRSRCIKCTNEKNREWHKANKISISKRKNTYNKENYFRVNRAKRDERYRKRYNITLDKYEEMLAEQLNRCAICGAKTKLVVDHCHNTKLVRGLLCQPCNLGLGAFRDSLDNLEYAMLYLTEALLTQ